MHANYIRPRLSWTPLALIATSILLSGGCAKFYHEWHYNYITKSLHEHRLSYYHSPHSGRMIPKEHHQVCPVDLPCFGYESTCWHRWPAECVNCPVDRQGAVIVHGPYGNGHSVEEEVILQPSEAESLQPSPAEAVAPPVDPADVLDSTDAFDPVPGPTEGARQPEPLRSAMPLTTRVPQESPLADRSVVDTELPSIKAESANDWMANASEESQAVAEERPAEVPSAEFYSVGTQTLGRDTTFDGDAVHGSHPCGRR